MMPQSSSASCTATRICARSPGPSRLVVRRPPGQGDSVQLQQVILNLMLNAFSAMSGTESTARAVWHVRTNSIDESNMLIEVQDSGLESPRKSSSRLRSLHHQQAGRTRNRPFDPVAPSSNATAVRYRLRTIRPRRDILDRAAGHPRVNLTVQYFGAPGVCEGEPTINGDGVVLIVDDHAALARSLVSLFSASGFDTQAVHSQGRLCVGPQPRGGGADSARHVLPDISESEVLRAIRVPERRALPFAAVVMFSAADDQRLATAHSTAGATDFVSKRPGGLLRVVSAYVRPDKSPRA